MIDFERVKGSVDLREVVLRYTTLDRGGHGPCPFCGGTDRFYIHRGGDRCGCRGCNFQGDAIELVHKAEGVNRAEAAKMLGGKLLPDGNPERGRSQNSRPTKKEPDIPPIWLGEAWQTRARTIVERAEARLIGSPGAAYFDGRGITEGELLKDQRIGYVPDHLGRPAVVLPWFDGDSDNVTAIKYRFIDQGKQRFAQEKGSEPILYGPIQVIGSDSDTLIVVEGEINALALAQATSKLYEVVSVGSEGNTKGLDALAEQFKVKGYSRLLFWFDKPERAMGAAKRFPGSAAMQSPEGKDAADLLVEHDEIVLGELVSRVLNERYPGRGPVRQRLSSSLGPKRGLASLAKLQSSIGASRPRLPNRDVLNGLYSELSGSPDSVQIKSLYLSLDSAAMQGLEQLDRWLTDRKAELVRSLLAEEREGQFAVRALLDHVYDEEG